MKVKTKSTKKIGASHEGISREDDQTNTNGNQRYGTVNTQNDEYNIHHGV